MHQRFIPALCKSGPDGRCDATDDCTGELVCDDATKMCTESCHTFISNGNSGADNIENGSCAGDPYPPSAKSAMAETVAVMKTARAHLVHVSA